MDFNEYQKRAIKFDTACVPTSELDLCYGYMEKLLGLAGEAGEVLEKVKKSWWRNQRRDRSNRKRIRRCLMVSFGSC